MIHNDEQRHGRGTTCQNTNREDCENINYHDTESQNDGDNAYGSRKGSYWEQNGSDRSAHTTRDMKDQDPDEMQ